MSGNARYWGASSALMLLAGCGSFDGVDDNLSRTAPPVASSNAYGAVSDQPVKIGEPYKVGGKTYTPADVQGYDEVGYASWYGDELAGNQTANGERFNPDGISAAHKTLPLPTYVEVTALDTGRTILVRINDRGPFANDRLLDLSHGAAKQLGIDAQGVAGVRVRKVNPNEQERAVLRNGGIATERIATPDSLLTILRKNLSKQPRPAMAARSPAIKPRPASKAVNASGVGASYVPVDKGARPVSGSRDGLFIIEGPNSSRSTATQPAPSPRTTTKGYVVQVGAFSDKNRAQSLARKIGAKVMSDGTSRIWRVRYGPYGSEAEAENGLAQARQKGYGNAKILRAGN